MSEIFCPSGQACLWVWIHPSLSQGAGPWCRQLQVVTHLSLFSLIKNLFKVALVQPFSPTWMSHLLTLMIHPLYLLKWNELIKKNVNRPLHLTFRPCAATLSCWGGLVPPWLWRLYWSGGGSYLQQVQPSWAGFRVEARPKSSTWPFRLGVGRRANNPTL